MEPPHGRQAPGEERPGQDRAPLIDPDGARATILAGVVYRSWRDQELSVLTSRAEMLTGRALEGRPGDLVRR